MPAKNLGNFVTKTQLNGGYYFGRYEASKGTDEKVDLQFDKASWINITQQEAAMAARNMYNSNYVESDLINSYSWDTAIVFIQKYSANTDYANRNSINSGGLNTGKSGDKVCNIYDMSSNCYEWSTESCFYTSYNYVPCVYRGGGYSSGGRTHTKSRGESKTSHRAAGLSFRVLLYIE